MRICRILTDRRMKMKMVTIEFKLPKEIFDQASEIFAGQGLTVEDACVLFLEETARLGRIPFEYTEEDLREVRRLEKLINDDICNV